MRRTASWPVVNRAARAGGIGPDEARRRRRSREVARSGEVTARFGGNRLTRPAGMPTGLIPSRFALRRPCSRSASAWASLSPNVPDPCPVGRRQPQCRRTLADDEGAGLPRIAPRDWGMGDAPPARRAGQHRAASACAVGANLGAAADDGSRPVDQDGDADRGRCRGWSAGAG